MLELQPITFRGRLVAVANSRRFFLCDDLDARPPDDPELAFVALMALYAIEVAAGAQPGPYTDDNARRFARACLLEPGVGELLEREDLDVARVARALRIPIDELRLAIVERRSPSCAPPASPSPIGLRDQHRRRNCPRDTRRAPARTRAGAAVASGCL